MTLALHPHGDFSANVAAFCAVLRRGHGFTIGPGEAADALRAIETVGVSDLARVRTALRLVLCAKEAEAAIFDGVFDQFFLPDAPRGARQDNLRPRHTRPEPEPPPPMDGKEVDAPPQLPRTDTDTADDLGRGPRRRYPIAQDEDDQPALRFLRARYSAAAAEAAAPDVARAGLDAMLEAAGALVRRLRLGRSRRWRAMPDGARFDVRRTMRASLQTGGEVLTPLWRGRPRRNPRIVVIIDGSRSMHESAGIMLQFAYAVSQRTRRLDAFVFSTDLRDVTHQLRRLGRGGSLRLTGLEDAWGGGTRIGACAERFITEFGYRCLSSDTVVFILSDGLDVGDPARLAHALRELQRRSAGVVWLNPLLGTPGYAPSARGMRAALPYVDLFTAANDAQAFGTLARTLRLGTV